MKNEKTPLATRRTALEAGAIFTAASLVRGIHAAQGSGFKVGLIGCGGRGTGAAVQALKADANAKVTALGDLFPDRIENSRRLLARDEEIGKRVDVPKERSFTGIDAYQKVINSGVDVVLMATPPHFRPLHIEAAVKAGKHVFAEKPVAVDAPGVRRVMAACDEAKTKNVCVVSGLCWRYEFGVRAVMKEIFAGRLGKINSVQSVYNASLPGKPWPMVREPGWSDMEWQLRNWYWFTWLSGDHIVEQAVHSIDKGSWALRDKPPIAATGMGGLEVRKAAERGNIYDHHSVVYEYDDGVRHFHQCRQMTGAGRDVSTHLWGTKGYSHVEKYFIKDLEGNMVWNYKGEKNIMHQTEHDEFFAALRAGKTINDGEYMCRSTMLAILGRMATYSGQRVTWEQALNSKEDMTPPNYNFGPFPTPKVAVPGVYKVF